jgi:hypothetical protein
MYNFTINVTLSPAALSSLNFQSFVHYNDRVILLLTDPPPPPVCPPSPSLGPFPLELFLSLRSFGLYVYVSSYFIIYVLE